MPLAISVWLTITTFLRKSYSQSCHHAPKLSWLNIFPRGVPLLISISKLKSKCLSQPQLLSKLKVFILENLWPCTSTFSIGSKKISQEVPLANTQHQQRKLKIFIFLQLFKNKDFLLFGEAVIMHFHFSDYEWKDFPRGAARLLSGKVKSPKISSQPKNQPVTRYLCTWRYKICKSWRRKNHIPNMTRDMPHICF